MTPPTLRELRRLEDQQGRWRCPLPLAVLLTPLLLVFAPLIITGWLVVFVIAGVADGVEDVVNTVRRR